MKNPLIVESPQAVDQIAYWRSCGYEGGFVYFMQATEEWPVKIGYATDPVDRLRQLQTGNSAHLRLLYVIPGVREDERWLHRKYANARRSGEWFSGPDLADILQYARDASEMVIAEHDGSSVVLAFPRANQIRPAKEIYEVRRAIEGWIIKGCAWPDVLELAAERFPDWTADELAGQRDIMARSSIYDVRLRINRSKPYSHITYGSRWAIEQRPRTPEEQERFDMEEAQWQVLEQLGFTEEEMTRRAFR